MADDTSPDTHELPDNPDLEWLRKEAKRRLRAMLANNPDARLSDAQLQLARQYGFASWRALKSHIDALTIDPLVSSALEQAEHSPPPVKAAALLSLARVVSARRQDEGLRVLERGIATAQTLREPARHVLLCEAFRAASALSPDQAFALLPEIAEDVMVDSRIQWALQQMLEHGHHAAAIRYLLEAPERAPFPFDAMTFAIPVADEETRAALLRKAMRAARAIASHEREGLHRELSEFLSLFEHHWRAMPPDEARALLRELVAGIVAAEDQRGQFTLQGARFSSTRQHLLFQLFGPLRHLEPELAASLTSDYGQLAKAVARFPYATESMYESVSLQSMEGPPREPPTDPEPSQLAEMDYLTMGDGFLPVAQELRTNFDGAFRVALGAHTMDTDPRRPNGAPQYCWPSAFGFRSILYKAGLYEGRAAVRHLDRVPDPALRLFAQIELAAALAGLSQMGGAILSQAPEVPARRVRGRHQDPPVDVDPFPQMPPPIIDKPDVPPSYDVRIEPSRHTGLPRGGHDADFWVIEGARLAPVLTELFDISAARMILPASLQDARYDFTLVLPREETREALLSTMRGAVERYFKVRYERRSVDVQVITAPHGIRGHESFEAFGGGIAGISGGSFEFFQPMSTESAPDFEAMMYGSLMDLSDVPSGAEQFEHHFDQAKRHFLRFLGGGGTLRGLQQALTMRELCIVLEGVLDRIFVDETGTTATYRINVQADVADSSAFLKVLCDELGLVVASGRREIELLVVG